MMKNIFILCFNILLSFELYSQHVFEINGDIFGRRVFIKNNGQFDDALPNHQTIDYAYINGTEQVYFNKTGVTYLLQKPEPLTHQQREDREHGKSITVKPTIKKNIHVTWENANPDVEIIEAEKQLYYHSFGELKFKSNCYKKIIYKNVYDHIDIEYVFTTEKDKGIKYNVILHPGANIADIKINYSGDVQNISLKKGNVVIQTGIIDVTELAPVSYQNGLQIVSNFSINDHTITFQLPNGYDTGKELMIDPWVINLSFGAGNGTAGYDVDYDAAGNYYVYGGGTGGNSVGANCISKYNSSGVLIWTFGGVVSAIGWNTITANSIGNFVVDKGSGKTYIGEAYTNLAARIIRLDANGIYDNFVTKGDSLFTEIWDLGFNCATGSVYGFGGTIDDITSAGIVNTTTGAFVAQNLTGYINNEYSQDVVSHTIDPSGNIFLVFASNNITVTNQLLKVNAAFTGNIWMAPTTYTTLMEVRNKNYPSIETSESNGFNCLASNNSYLYYYDGLNLAAYNKTTGAKIGFTTLVGQTEKEQGGIAVDDCNNLYLGGNGSIVCYTFDGATFTANGNIPVASDTAIKYKYVTDIMLNAGSNNLYVSGSGFGGIYSAINSITCTITNSLTITSLCKGSGIANAMATLTTHIVSPVISYSWTNSLGVVVSQTINSALLTNTAINLPNGSYTITAQINELCGPMIISQSFSIACPTCTLPVVGSIFGSNTICPNSTQTYSTAVVPDATSYTWLLPNGWTGSSNTNTISVTSGNTAGTMSVMVTNTCGVSSPSLMLVSFYTPPAVTASGGSICPGSSFTIVPSGALSYTYSSGSAVVSPTTTTTYTITGSNVINGCAVTNSVVITVSVSAQPTITALGGFICVGSSFTINPSGASTYSYSGGSSVVSPIVTTTYTVTGATNGCTASTITTVTVVNPPSLSVNSPTLCSGTSTILMASGATTYTWNTGVSSTSINVSPITTTSYTVTGSNGACSTTTVSNVSVTAAPNLTISPNILIVSGSSTPLSVAGGTAYNWAPALGLSCTTCSNPIASPSVTTEYCASSSNGSCVGKTCVNISVEHACFSNTDYSVPNAFTPNGDGINDEFCLEGWAHCTTTFYVGIYDQWGEKVFESTDPDFVGMGFIKAKF